jgi:TatD DNase family protein
VPCFIDSHCHLTSESFVQDLDQVIAAALAVGVDKIVVPGVDLESSTKSVNLANSHSHLYAAVGVHPEACCRYSASQMEALRHLAQDEKVVAIGEIGLDFHYQPMDVELQKSVFKEMLALASSVGKPVLIHSRDSMETVLQMVDVWVNDLKKEINADLVLAPGIFHAFEGDLDQAKKAVQNHFALGVGGPITYKNATLKHLVFSQIELEHLVLETDAPYLPPTPFRGKRNEPSHIKEIAEKLSELSHQPLESVAVQTTECARNIFRWDN